MSGLARFARPTEWIFAASMLVWLARAHGPLRDVLRHRGVAHALLALLVVLLIRHRRELRAQLAACWPLLLPVVVVALSPIWSIDALESVRDAAALETYTAFGLWFALRFDAVEQHRLVAGAVAFILAASAFSVLVAPEFSTMHGQHAGAWKGILTHKNGLGRCLGLGVLACGLLAWALPASRVWAGIVAMLALAMFIPTRSVGAVAALVLTLIPVGLVVGLRHVAPPARLRVAILACAAIAAIAAIAIATAPTWLAWIGREPTLTRRTEIWALVIPTLAEHPWFGYGAGAFWNVAEESREIRHALQFRPSGAHNFFLDLTLELGIVGCLAFIVPFAAASTRAVRLVLTQPGAGSLWPLAFLTWCIASTLTESTFMVRGPLGWAIFIATAATLAARPVTLSQQARA